MTCGVRALSTRMGAICLLIFICLCCTREIASASPAAFDLAGFYPLSANSLWHFRGEGQPGSSADSNFRRFIPSEKKTVAAGIDASRITTSIDRTSTTLAGDEEFWYLDGEGRLLIYGFRNGAAYMNGLFPSQDVVLNTPLLVGGKNQKIGDIIKTTSSASVSIVLPIFGKQTLDASVASTITYLGFIPTLDTGIGPLANILHMSIRVGGYAIFDPIIGDPMYFEFPAADSELFLKEGLGMVAYDGSADLNRYERLTADVVQVNGIPQTPPPFVSYNVYLTPDQSTSLSQPLNLLTGSGAASVTLNTINNTLQYTLRTTNLNSTRTSETLNGPAARGLAGPAVAVLPSGNPKAGIIPYQETSEWSILAGLTYFNIATTGNPLGEIRGQIDQGFIKPASADEWNQY